MTQIVRQSFRSIIFLSLLSFFVSVCYAADSTRIVPVQAQAIKTYRLAGYGTFASGANREDRRPTNVSCLPNETPDLITYIVKTNEMGSGVNVNVIYNESTLDHSVSPYFIKSTAYVGTSGGGSPVRIVTIGWQIFCITQ